MRCLALALALAAAVAGCGTGSEPAIPRAATEVVTPQVQALRALDDARVWAAAVANVIASARDAGVYTPEQVAAYKVELTKRLDEADRIEAAVKAGVLSEYGRAEVLKNVLITLHKKVAEEARKKP